MDFELFHAILDDEVLTAPQKLIAVTLLRYSDKHGRSWPCQETIGKNTSMTSRAVRENLHRLVDFGWVSVSKEGRHHVYVLAKTPEPRSAIKHEHRNHIPVSEVEIPEPRSATPEPRSQNTGTRFLPTNKGTNQEPATAVVSKVSKAKTEELPPLPFTSDEFKTAWDEWLKFRQSKRKPIDAQAARLQFRQMVKWGESASITIIETSIMNSWQGLFPPKQLQAKIHGQYAHSHHTQL